MPINIHQSKLELIQWLSTMDDAELISRILAIKNEESRDWWLNATDAEKRSIQKGLEDAEAGKLNQQSDAHRLYGKWL